MPSLVTEKKLKELAEEVLLPSQEEIKWRVPGDESRPASKEGEVIVFAEHVIRGFRPPGSRFFMSILNSYKLHRQDLSANSLLNICHFQVFCEVYLQKKPSLGLFASSIIASSRLNKVVVKLWSVGASLFRNVPIQSFRLLNGPARLRIGKGHIFIVP